MADALTSSEDIAEKRIEFELYDSYNNFNKTFFEGKLPDCKIIICDLPPRIHGRLDKKRRTIYIDVSKANSPQERRRTLLHEMCHFRAKHHGIMFQEQLQRLADSGETWAAGEIETWKKSSWNRMMSEIKNELWAIAQEQYGDSEARSTFKTVLEYFASHYGFETGELLEKAPWMPRAWEKAKEEARRSWAILL